MSPYGTPGIGDSLGECALCGEPFIVEIVLGKSIKSFTMPEVKRTLFGHDACIEKYDGTDVAALPEKSALRKAWERAQRKEPA